MSLSAEALAASLLLAIHLESDYTIGKLTCKLTGKLFPRKLVYQLLYKLDSKMTILINVVNDSKKHLFSNEKFYTSLNEQGNLVIGF